VENVLVHGTIDMKRSILRRPDTQGRLILADDEVEAAWNIFSFNWRLLASAAGVVVAVLVATEFYVETMGYLVAFALAGLYWWFGLRNARSTTHANPKVFLCLVALAQLVMAVPVILTLTYVAVSINLPLQDARLLAWDRALGFDFRSFLDFTNHHRELIPLLAQSYSSINLQLLVIVLLLPLTGCYRRVAETVCAVTLAILATTLIAALIPAIGVYGALGLQASDFPQLVPQAYYDTLRDVPLVREGRLHKLSLTQLSGVLTFPSFHAASAILFMWACWPLRWVRLVVIPWNIVMMVATPPGGGHYLVDVLAGVLVAIASIGVTSKISGICSPKRIDALPSDVQPLQSSR
jgi:membrane-associated phospholipid phosphatase